MGNKKISLSELKSLFESRFLKVFDIQYAPGKHYYNATRRTAENTAAVKSDEEFREMIPDAVSCFVIIEEPGQEAKLLLTKEYRYPVGRFVLSVPAGLIDPEDCIENSGKDGMQDGIKEDSAEKTICNSPALTAAVREIKEETGITISEKDQLTLINPLVFSSPGMTDESNALVCAVLHPTGDLGITQTGAVGSECFNGYMMINKKEAAGFLKNGRDEEGFFYSGYTWMALMYFVSDMWEAGI